MKHSSRWSRIALVEFGLLLTGLALVTISSSRLIRFEAFQKGLNWLTVFPEASHSGKDRLSIPRLGMSVLIVDGADEDSLALAAGHLKGTPEIGQPGNAVIAGHRDMAFRALRDIRIGDELRVESHKTYRFIVSKTRIVSPDDLTVLQSHDTPEITLITCYPFSYFGSAPKRFVVQAQLLAD